jgi:hypothetical protein
MPSVGSSAVGWVQSFRLAASSVEPAAGALQAVARFCVWMRLVSSAKGLSSLPANTTCSMRTPLARSSLSSPWPLLVKVLGSDCCQAVLSAGTGSQTRVAPWGLSRSTRVVTSKVRQAPGCGLNWRSGTPDADCAKLIAGNAATTLLAAIFLINWRRAKRVTVVMKRTPGWVGQRAQTR